MESELDTELDPFRGGIIFSIVGIGLFINGLRLFRKKRLIEDIPTSKINSIAMGLVELFGEVVPSENKILKSPFTNSDCVYYKYSVEEYVSNKRGGRWVTIKEGEISVHFCLRDDTGSVLVESEGAEIDIPLDFECQSRWGKDPPELIKKFIESEGLSFEDFLGINKTMRYREYCIAPSDKLYVMGTAGDNPFMEEGRAQKGSEDIMVYKGKENGIYYISDRKEKEIVKRFKWQSILQIFLGGASAIGGLFVILSSLL